MKTVRIGEVLVSEGYITQAQLDKAIELQRASGSNKRLGAIILENNMITEDQMQTALSAQLGVPYVHMEDQQIMVDAVEKIPKQVAMKYNIIAVAERDGTLVLAVSDPLDFYGIEDIKLIVNMPVSLIISLKSEIDQAIAYWYSEIEAKNAALVANQAAGIGTRIQIEDLSGRADDTPVVVLVNSILFKSHSAGASDIHIEPFDDKTSVRIRVDGQIIDFLTLSQGLHNSLITRIKILSGLDIAEKRIPQDGHFRAKQNDVEINVRVSVLPTIYGEKAVLRFLSRNTSLDHSGTFGMDNEDYTKILKILQRPYGIVYITGPTGSGKTTTLYMILEALSRRAVNISTIEDPVERNLPGINQTQTNNLAGLTFESGLRSLLRQDPDIIMVGETRDSETASIAVSAALTGHLVLSTLHTNDAVSAIVRLTDMGVQEYMIANALTGVVAQRLAKKICPNCRTAYRPTEPELVLLGRNDVNALYKGAGCNACNHTGYKGRIAIHEILSIDVPIQYMVSKKEPMENVYKYLQENKLLTTLRDSMTKLVLQGVSTTEQMLAIINIV